MYGKKQILAATIAAIVMIVIYDKGRYDAIHELYKNGMAVCVIGK